MSARLDKSTDTKPTTIATPAVTVQQTLPNEPVQDNVKKMAVPAKNNTDTLMSNINRCYAIDEKTYACVTVSLSTRKGIEFAKNTTDLVSQKELPSDLVCTQVSENMFGNITNASVCTNDPSNISRASDQLFKDFIPIVLTKLDS